MSLAQDSFHVGINILSNRITFKYKIVRYKKHQKNNFTNNIQPTKKKKETKENLNHQVVSYNETSL